MPDPKCSSPHELEDYVHGRLQPPDLDIVADHVEQCGDCQATVVMLAEKSDTLVEQLRSPPVPDALETESACQAAVARLAARAANRQPGPMTTYRSVDDIEHLGPYRIQAKLGCGGMGTVFEAVHTKLKRTVALKLLPASRWANPAAIARFEREMEIIGQLDHPNIVRASDAGEENGMHYLVMEHVDGLDLSRIVNRVGTLSVADACEIARQAAIGLQYASENHLVHRDIKPSNLMLAKVNGQGSRVQSQNGNDAVRLSKLNSGPSTSVKILDLGLALLGEAHAGHENELTTVGQLMGTLDYMSPEQGLDSHDVDIRADIYSLGATLYKLLTGRAPFAMPQYNTLMKKVTALANKPVTPIKQLRPDIPDELASIIDRMLAKDPGERFQSPDEVAAALEPFSQGADLAGLLTAALKAPEPKANSIPPVIPPGQFPLAPATSTKEPQATRGVSGGRFIGLLTLLILFALAAGIIIRIATDNGELIVRAEEDAQVLVRRNGTTVRQLEVEKGNHTVTVRSGNYELELKTKSDELMISRNAVSIKRGERVVVHVQHRPKSVSGMEGMMGMEMYGGEEGMDGMADMMGLGSGGTRPERVPSQPDPTYDGRTYSQWLAELRTERKPERLTEAIRAFASLGAGDEELAARSATAIMEVMRRNGARVIDDSPQGKLIEKAREVLLQMPGETVIRAIEDELRDGNTRSRTFIISWLLSGTLNRSTSVSKTNVELEAAVSRSSDSLCQLLLSLPDDEVAQVRADALSLVVGHAEAQSVAFDEIESLVPRLQTALSEKDLEVVAVGTAALVKFDPDHKDLVPRLIRLVKSQNPSHRLNAVRSLGELGARSHAAVESLVKIIQPLADADAKLSVNLLQTGDMYGGGMGLGSEGFGGGGMYGGYDPSLDIYYVTIEALGKIGPAAKEALPLLRQIAARPLAYSEWAAAAIAKIEGKKVESNSEQTEPSSSKERP
ncbi:MAG: protein kinase [Pirellulaceae bacterium]